MADINFGILDTQSPAKIGNAFIRSPEQQNANMLQVMQMQQLMDQREQAQYALGKSRREETGMAEFGNAIKALGPDPSLLAIAQVFMKHPNPEYQLKGFELQRQAQETDRYARANAPAPGPAFGGAAPAASAPESFGAEVATRKAQLFGPAPDRTNMMPGAAVAPAEVNNLPAAFTPPQVKTQIDSLRERIDANLALGTDRGYKTAENLQKQLIELNRRYTVGNTLMGSEGNVFGTAPEKLPAPPSMVAEYTFAKTPDGGGFRGSFQDFVIARSEAVRPPRPEAAPRTQQVQMLDGTLGIMNMDTGAITAGTMGGKPVQGKSTATAEKALTEPQGNATAYGLRMKEAEAILENLAKQGVLRGAMVEGVPFVGGAYAKALPSALGGTSQQEQQVNQAKSNFITAVLRKESGAVISDSEFAREDEKYFPQVNDGPGVIKQKANARRLAIEAMKFQAGPGAKEIDKYVPNAATGKTSATLSEPPPGAVRPRGSR